MSLSEEPTPSQQEISDSILTTSRAAGALGLPKDSPLRRDVIFGTSKKPRKSYAFSGRPSVPLRRVESMDHIRELSPVFGGDKKQLPFASPFIKAAKSEAKVSHSTMKSSFPLAEPALLRAIHAASMEDLQRFPDRDGYLAYDASGNLVFPPVHRTKGALVGEALIDHLANVVIAVRDKDSFPEKQTIESLVGMVKTGSDEELLAQLASVSLAKRTRQPSSRDGLKFVVAKLSNDQKKIKYEPFDLDKIATIEDFVGKLKQGVLTTVVDDPRLKSSIARGSEIRANPLTALNPGKVPVFNGRAVKSRNQGASKELEALRQLSFATNHLLNDTHQFATKCAGAVDDDKIKKEWEDIKSIPFKDQMLKYFAIKDIATRDATEATRKLYGNNSLRKNMIEATLDYLQTKATEGSLTPEDKTMATKLLGELRLIKSLEGKLKVSEGKLYDKSLDEDSLNVLRATQRLPGQNRSRRSRSGSASSSRRSVSQRTPSAGQAAAPSEGASDPVYKPVSQARDIIQREVGEEVSQ